MTHKSSFDIRTAGDFFREVVIPQYKDFLSDNSSSRHALLTTIVSYHFYEWVHHDVDKFTIERFNSSYPGNASMANYFETARKITNGTKHYKNKGVETRTQRGFSSGFNDGFSRSLMIELMDGNEQSADVFLRKLIDFWTAQKEAGAF